MWLELTTNLGKVLHSLVSQKISLFGKIVLQFLYLRCSDLISNNTLSSISFSLCVLWLPSCSGAKFYVSNLNLWITFLLLKKLTFVRPDCSKLFLATRYRLLFASYAVPKLVFLAGVTANYFWLPTKDVNIQACHRIVMVQVLSYITLSDQIKRRCTQ